MFKRLLIGVIMVLIIVISYSMMLIVDTISTTNDFMTAIALECDDLELTYINELKI